MEIPEFGQQWAQSEKYYDYLDDVWIDTSPIVYCMEKIGDNDGFYNFLKLVPIFPDWLIAWIIGARRMGKTDAELR